MGDVKMSTIKEKEIEALQNPYCCPYCGESEIIKHKKDSELVICDCPSCEGQWKINFKIDSWVNVDEDRKPRDCFYVFFPTPEEAIEDERERLKRSVKNIEFESGPVSIIPEWWK